jgi:predicted nucleic acid-binding protein
VKYCIDTSALIDAWVRWYPKEVFQTLWEKVEGLIEADRFISSEEVLQELERKEGDTLFQWAKDRRHVFLPLDGSIQACASQIMATYPRLVDGRTGKSFADPWVVATARTNGCIVVTGEKPTGKPQRPKIPDVCRGMGIRWIGFFDLIREENWRF